jgi:DNA-binding CsgD family transcriptional regulator
MTLEIDNLKQAALEHHRISNPIFINLCQPLVNLGIKGYYYIKCHHDGSYLIYSSNIELSESHIKFLRRDSDFFKNSVDIAAHSQSSFLISGDIQNFNTKTDPVLGFIWDFDLWNMFTLYNMKGADLLEGWGFSLGRDHRDPLGFFLRKKVLLERFVQYFDVVGKNITNTLDKNKLAFYDYSFTFFEKSQDIKLNDQLEEFFRQTSLDKLTFLLDQKNIHLTQRQGECLYYLEQNYSVKEIANTLMLSPRTVESYIQAVKEKFRVSTKSDLINFLHKHELNQKLPLLKR